MKAIRYLNTVLTILAVLLALQLWTTWTSAPGAATVASAQASPAPGGIPDAGAQRKEMIDLLKLAVQKLEEQTQLLKSGQVKVRVEKTTEKE